MTGVLSACEATYKADSLEQSLKEVLSKEYDIQQVEVRTKGKTLGVYLPLEKLFSANLDAFSSANLDDGISNLFEFNKDAMDKVEDVLFTTSRVVLSTDKEIDFYVLKAVETKSTGIEFVLTGNVMDMKQVRFWHIPLSEYRKRLLHDLSVNRTIVWKRTITDFFDSIGKITTVDLFNTYFANDITIKDISPFFFAQLAEAEHKEDLRYEMIDIRTKPINEREVLVYVKQAEQFTPRKEDIEQEYLFLNGQQHEYLFVLQADKMAYKVRQVIPFYFVNKETNKLHAIDFPDELKIYDNIGSWSEEFELEEVLMGPFLAHQLTKRIQALVAQDEELATSFLLKKIECVYHDEKSEVTNEGPLPKYFSIEYDLGAQAFMSVSLYPNKEREEIEDAIRDLLKIIVSEFTVVVNGYSYRDFSYLELINSDSGKAVIIPSHDLQSINIGEMSIDSFITQKE